MKVSNIFAIIFATSLTAGCAGTSEIESLQSQIDELKTQISTASSDASKAQAAAQEAASQASSAEAAANRAAQYAEDTNSKLDRMFKKSMMK